MADLTTLDATQPPDSESAGQGASRIRDTRDAILTSFGIEHALTGIHKFLSGNQAARPAAGNANRIYINTTDKRVERDDGTTWDILNTVQIYSDEQAGSFALTSSMQNIASITADIAPGSRVLAIGQFAVDAPATSIGSCQITQGGTLLGLVRLFGASGASEWNGNVVMFAYAGTPTSGSVIYALQASMVFASTVNVSKRHIIVFVL